MTALTCGHQADRDLSLLPSIGEGGRICLACHGEAARAVLARLRPGSALVMYRHGDRLTTWFDQTLLTVEIASRRGTLFARDEHGRIWQGRPWRTPHSGRYVMTLTDIDNVKVRDD